MHLYTHTQVLHGEAFHPPPPLGEKGEKGKRRDPGARLKGKMASGGGYQGNHVFPRAAAAPSAGMAGMPRPNQSGPTNPVLAAAAGQPVVREQDRFMPIANVIRIMRKVLPTHAKISDDAKETIQECVSEYISFITSEANDRCQREQRKTVTAEDVLWAMNKLGFDNYIEPLTLYLHRYRELEGDHRGSIRGEPLQLIKHRNVSMQALSDMMNASAPMMFSASPQVAPQPNFAVPPSSAGSHSLQHFGLLGDQGMGSYLLGMYNGGGGGGGDGSSNGNSSQAPGMPSFDHPYASYK